MKFLSVVAAVILLSSQASAGAVEEKTAIKLVQDFHQAYFNEPSGIDDLIAPGIRRGDKLHFPDAPRPMPVRSMSKNNSETPVGLDIVDVKHFTDDEYDVYMTTVLLGPVGQIEDRTESTVLFWLKYDGETPKIYRLTPKNRLVFDALEKKAKDIANIVASGGVKQINNAFDLESDEVLNDKIQWVSQALSSDDVSFSWAGQGVFGEGYRSYFRIYDKAARKSVDHKIEAQCEFVGPTLNVACNFVF